MPVSTPLFIWYYLRDSRFKMLFTTFVIIFDGKQAVEWTDLELIA